MKKFFKATLKRFGLRLTRHPSNLRWENLIDYPNVDTIIDVGVGHGTPHLYSRYPNAYLILIEPIRHFSDGINKILSERNGEFHHVAVGDRADTNLTINYRRDVPEQSSRLQRRKKFKHKSESIEKETVELQTLDNLIVFGRNPLPSGNILLKIDTQGSELEALRGAEKLLQLSDIVIVHSAVIARHNQSYALFEVIKTLDAHGLKLTSVLNALIDNEQRCRVVDLLFSRPK